jgi:TMEM175 potassium channel family protein
MASMLRRLIARGVVSEPLSEDESGKALDRLVAFSDGVFAIAMTLLVLNLTVPTITGSAEHVNEVLWDRLRDQWPELLSYAISFWVIGRFWLIHHRVFRLVRRADGLLLTLNLLLLGFIALIPWPTEMLGRYGDTTTAVVAYSVVMVCVGVSSAMLTWHIQSSGLMDERVTPQYRRASLARSMMVPLGFGLGIPVAFVDPTAAMLTWWVGIVLMSIVAGRRFGGVRDPYGTAAGPGGSVAPR